MTKGHGLFSFASEAGVNAGNGHGSNPLPFYATIEAGRGTYNWSVIENVLVRAAAKGKTAIIRIYTNVGGHGQGMPGWFFSSGGQQYRPQGNYISPVPWDNFYKEIFGKFLVEFGTKYNGDPRIEFLQTNAGGGVYGESWPGTNMPPGFNRGLMVDTQKYWCDKWRLAFPNTALCLQVNGGWAEEVAPYAVSKKYYLQNNDPYRIPTGIMAPQRDATKLIVEAEDRGGQHATMASGFQGMIDTMFAKLGEGKIDYFTLRDTSFNDGATHNFLPNATARLRKNPPVPAPGTIPIPTPEPIPGPEPIPAKKVIGIAINEAVITFDDGSVETFNPS